MTSTSKLRAALPLIFIIAANLNASDLSSGEKIAEYLNSRYSSTSSSSSQSEPLRPFRSYPLFQAIRKDILKTSDLQKLTNDPASLRMFTQSSESGDPHGYIYFTDTSGKLVAYGKTGKSGTRLQQVESFSNTEALAQLEKLMLEADSSQLFSKMYQNFTARVSGKPISDIEIVEEDGTDVDIVASEETQREITKLALASDLPEIAAQIIDDMVSVANSEEGLNIQNPSLESDGLEGPVKRQRGGVSAENQRGNGRSGFGGQ